MDNKTTSSSRLKILAGEINAELARRTAFDETVPPRLTDAVRHGLLAPGKRLRPVLTLLAAELCGADYVRAIPAACAVEMVHAYSLIHDDLPAMDNDVLRRGEPTVWKKFDEATAILAGDALLTLAFETVGQVEPESAAARCSIELAKAAGVAGMVGGQADDVFFAARTVLTPPDEMDKRLEAIHRRKTGAMILVALRLGALVAGANAERESALVRYGESLGLAFQITDDLLDLTGDEKAMGKRLHKDAEAGKLTFPAVFGLDESRQRAAVEIETARGALDIFDESPAKTTLAGLAESLLERNH